MRASTEIRMRISHWEVLFVGHTEAGETLGLDRLFNPCTK